MKKIVVKYGFIQMKKAEKACVSTYFREMPTPFSLRMKSGLPSMIMLEAQNHTLSYSGELKV